jgi:dimethylamine monooxygenase subunit A
VPRGAIDSAMDPILQSRLPVAPWMAAHTMRLPGTGPVAMADWLVRDEVFAEQMALRDRLIAERRRDVYALEAGAREAAGELLALILERLDPGYLREAEAVTRPDGAAVDLTDDPLLAAGRLVQEDLLLLQKVPGGVEHRLTGGILCFPSNWTLAEKMGKGLARIHLPVEDYDETVARRVQRLFDGLRPGTPIMRSNLLIYGVPQLYNPRTEWDRHRPAPDDERFIRVERQCLLKLPATGAVVFSIHTYMVRPEALTEEQREALLAVRPGALGGRP